MVVTRQVAIPVLANVAVVLVTSTVRGLRTEVPLGTEQGLDDDCVANCDNILTVPKASLRRLRGRLGPHDVARINDSLRVALELD